jgi:ornithine cyclodeaminase/alanine dehydrogenase-like protein (mu-crystallin family)
VSGEALPVIGGEQLRSLLPPAAAVEAIEEALRAGLDPAADPARTVVEMRSGQLLLMPTETACAAGVKIVSVAPANPARGLPRIQGVYLLLDAATLAPVALLDGTALTTLRTPAVSVAAVRPVLLRDDTPLRLVVFGAGPQALGHVDTLADTLRPRRPLASVTYLVRRPEQVVVPSQAHHLPPRVVASSGADADRAVAEADVIVCATTARAPLFDGARVPDAAVVIAVGSHEPDAQEVDGALAGRAQVVVEDVATAMREAGDVVQPIREGRLSPQDLIPMRDVVTGRRRPSADRPVLFTSTGMAWEDLVVATAVHERWQARP